MLIFTLKFGFHVYMSELIVTLSLSISTSFSCQTQISVAYVFVMFDVDRSE